MICDLKSDSEVDGDVAPKIANQKSSIISELLADQQQLLTPAATFAEWHDQHAEPVQARYYKNLIPLSKPGPGEQYAFEVNLDACTGCKACVVACHSLNGLDDNESWRDVGTITSTGYQQTVTTACHHCADPACSNGCPTRAYEKDAETGIVRHLDDQCIGCSYCTMKCPYDVPKFNLKRGIVRKCDMCHGRLAAGEAPACVQACPNEAISIRIVSMEQGARSRERMLPGAYASEYTRPMTSYVSAKEVPVAAMAVDAERLRVEEPHNPLAVMLVLTQAAAGGFVAASFIGEAKMLLWVSAALLFVGVNASVLHLGQPMKAWKAFLGWRKSWLSREIIAFGIAMGAAGAACVSFLPAWPAAVASLSAVACSIMVYVDTRREFWNARLTAAKFLGTTAILGCAIAACWEPGAALVAALLMQGKVLLEILHITLRPDNYSVRVMKEKLAVLIGLRVATSLLGIVAIFFVPPVGFIAMLVSEMLERAMFFRAVKAHRMPGI
jgi:formate dehydrogenase iron-sulfur subunit